MKKIQDKKMACILLYTTTFKKVDKLTSSNFHTYSLKISGRLHRTTKKQLHLMKGWDRKKLLTGVYLCLICDYKT